MDNMTGIGMMTDDELNMLNQHCQDRWQGIQDVGDLRTAPPGEPSDVVSRNDQARDAAADALNNAVKTAQNQ